MAARRRPFVAPAPARGVTPVAWLAIAALAGRLHVFEFPIASEFALVIPHTERFHAV